MLYIIAEYKKCLDYKMFWPLYCRKCSTFSLFSRACYCVIGHCDQKDDHTDVIISTDDYLWLKLHQLHVEDEDGDELTEDRLTLTQLQVMLLEEYGKKCVLANQWPRFNMLTSSLLATKWHNNKSIYFKTKAVVFALYRYSLVSNQLILITSGVFNEGKENLFDELMHNKSKLLIIKN